MLSYDTIRSPHEKNRVSPFQAVQYSKWSAKISTIFKGSNGFFETNLEFWHFVMSSSLFCDVDIFWKMCGYRNSLFHNFGKLRHRKIGFSFKFQVGYLETHFFTTLGEGVKHGIKISFEIMQFQITFFFDELRHYTFFEKCVGTETHFFINLEN